MIVSSVNQWVRWGLLALLPLIAVGVWLDGQRYDPGLLDFKKAAARLSPLVAYFPKQAAGLTRLGEVRRYQKENLHEYVNGHAEFFIGAGFRELIVGEYGTGKESGGAQVVVDLYDMGKPLHAFGVVTEESQPGAQPSAIGEMGSLDSRGLRFILGPYYIKISAFDDGEQLERLGQLFVESIGQVGKGVARFEFPDFGPPLTTRFIKDNYRGLDFFDHVLERAFEWQGQKIQLFLVGDSPLASQEIRDRLLAFYQKDGIEVEPLKRDGLSLFMVHDPYEGEWFFVQDQSRLIGVFGISIDAAMAPLKRFISNGDQAQTGKSH